MGLPRSCDCYKKVLSIQPVITCSKYTIETPEQEMKHIEHISELVLVFVLLPLSK